MKPTVKPSQPSSLVSFAVALVLAAVASFATPSRSDAAPGFLCSDGTNNGAECDFDSDCPNGACLAAQFICDGGSRDVDFCECPGSVCAGNTCAGGILQGESCDTDNNCSGGTCKQTARVCEDGDLKGFACINDGQCGSGESCIANGRLCWGGAFFKFACIDNDDCDPDGEPGTCRTPAAPLPLELLCSAGSDDGDMCESDDNCPGGACVVSQTVCDGGANFNGTFCESDTDCDPGSPCTLTQKICDAGENKSFGCLVSNTCPDGDCVSTGKYCLGGDLEDFSCVDDNDCPDGDCFTPDDITPVPTPTGPTPTRTPTGSIGPTRTNTPVRSVSSRRPTPPPTATPIRSRTTGGTQFTPTRTPRGSLTPQVIKASGCSVAPLANASYELAFALLSALALLRTRRR